MAPTEGKKKIARTCRPSFAYINKSSPIPDNAENEKALLVYNYEAKNTSSAIRNQWAFIGTTPNAIVLEDIPNEDVSMDSAETAVQSDGSQIIDSEIINEDEGYGTRPHGMKKLTGSMMQDEDCAIKLEDIPNEDVSMDSAETAVQSDGSKIDLEIINEDEGYGTRPHGMTGSMMQDEDWSITSQDEIMAPIVQNFVSCYGPAP